MSHENHVLIAKLFGEHNRSNPISTAESSRHQVYISSRDCELGGTPSKFTVNFDRSFYPDTIELVEFHSTNAIYNLADPIILEETGQPPLTVTFPPGIYTASNAAALIAAHLTSVSPSGATYTVVVDQFTLKVTITSTVLYRFNDINIHNRTYFNLGWNDRREPAPQVLALSQTSSGSFDFLPVIGNILIRVAQLHNGPVGVNSVPYNFTVPYSGVSRDMVSFAANTTTVPVYKHTGGNTFSKFSVELLTEDGLPLSIQGGQTYMTLQFSTRSEMH